jgi:hypothetical protein
MLSASPHLIGIILAIQASMNQHYVMGTGKAKAK